jgi:hypothetical protein
LSVIILISGKDHEKTGLPNNKQAFELSVLVDQLSFKEALD